jgi:ABC-type uncharacterized transport system involved in gliding motility auxiliary subunit
MSRAGVGSAVVVGVTLLFVALIARLASVRATWFFYATLIAGVVVVGVAAVVFRESVRDIARSRQATYGVVVGLGVLFVVGMAVVANMFAARWLDKQYDLTKEKFYSLSEQSLKIARSLKEPVHVIGFFTSDPSDFRHHDRLLAEQLLTLYRRASGGKLTYELVDPYQNPQRAREYDVEYESKTVFQMADRRETTSTASETEFTAALLKVAQEQPRKVYFLTAHDERHPEDTTRAGLRDAADALERQNYTVEALSLRERNLSIPADAAAVVVAGPRRRYEPEEIAALDDYAAKGGRLLVLLDPPTTELAALRDWLTRWGVLVGNDIVIDRGAHLLQSPMIPVGQFERHQITESLLRLGRPPAAFVGAASVRKAESPPPALQHDVLLQTTPGEQVSWAETNLDPSTTPRYDAGDIPGPVPLGIAVAQRKEPEGERPRDGKAEDQKPAARFVVIGDSDFASNAFFAGTGGGELFLNAVNWLTLREDLISIPPKDPSQRYMRPMTTRAEVLLLLAATMGFMPLVFGGIGVIVWLKRR